MSIENGMKVTPGQFLGYVYDFEIGERGIFQKEDKLYSSLSGKLIITQLAVYYSINNVSQKS